MAEKVLPESQCGFTKGRECVDIIFVARQLVEKIREHESMMISGGSRIFKKGGHKIMDACGHG